MVDKGVERNILVFDSESSPGIFTIRFFALAETIGKKNSTDNSIYIQKVYLSKDEVIACFSESVLASDWYKLYMYIMEEVDWDFQKYYETLQGSLAFGDVKLAVFEFNNGEVLLGSY